MKKKLFRLTMIAMTIVPLLFSCKKEKSAKSTKLNIQDFPTTIVYGRATANLDHTNTNEQYAPSGTKILIEVPYSTFDPSASGTYKVFTTVNAEGEYRAQVPVGVNAATSLTITLDEFFSTVKLSETKSEIQKFEASSATLSCLSGLTYEKKFEYSGSFHKAIGEYKEGTFEGIAYSIVPNPSDPDKNDTSIIADGTVVKMTVDKSNFTGWENDWTGNFTIGTGGTFSATAPSVAFEEETSGTPVVLSSSPVITVYKGSDVATWGCILGTAYNYSNNNTTIDTKNVTIQCFAGNTKKNIKLYFYGNVNMSN